VEGATCDEVVGALALTAALAVDRSAEHLKPPASAADRSSGGDAQQTAAKRDANAATGAPASAAEQRGTLPKSAADGTSSSNEPDAARVNREASPAEEIEASSEASIARRPGALKLELGGALVGAEVVRPELSFGAAVALRLVHRGSRFDRASIGVALLHTPGSLARDSVSVAWTAAVLSVCPGSLGTDAIWLSPCVLGSAGLVSVEGRDIAIPESVTRSLWSVGAVLRAGVALGPGGASLQLDVGASVPLLRRRFFTNSVEHVVGETPSLAGLASLGIHYVF
jgi:hypothetical protein